MTDAAPSPRTRVKICGIRTADDALAAADAGADAIGFIFVDHTPRYIDPDDAARIMHALPPFVTAVGVTRDLTPEAFADLEQRCPCVNFQLHGDEDEPTCDACGPGIIKALEFDPETIDHDLRRWQACAAADAVLVDGSEGGAGTAFHWPALAEAVQRTGFTKKLIVAGGLTPDNAAEAIAAVRPWAVDVSGGVELEGRPGVKDHARIAAFCQAARSA